MRLNATLLLTALLVTAGAWPTWGRVFYRRGHAERGYVAPERLGWAPAYRTRIRLNGGRGELDLLDNRASLQASLHQLHQAYETLGGQCFFYSSGYNAWGVVLVQGRVIRLFAFQLETDRQTLVMRLDQSEEDFLASQQVPQRHALESLPGHPGLRPTHLSADEGSGMALQVGRLNEVPDDVYAYYAEALDRDGWTAALPLPSHQREPSGFMLYARGREICLVRVQSSGQARETVLTLVYKKLDSKKVY
jgi:hypothetical protein